MGDWTSELTPSQQHHFRDAFEAELCARQVAVPCQLSDMHAAPSALHQKIHGYNLSHQNQSLCMFQVRSFDNRIVKLRYNVLCRVSRKTTLDEDLLIRVPHPQATFLADTIIKAGIHQYPDSEFLLIVQTGLRLYLKNEKPVSAWHAPCMPSCHSSNCNKVMQHR